MRSLAAATLIALAAPAVAQTPAADPGTSAAPAPAAEKKICKSQAVTSSLIAKRKMCFTRAEWNRIADSQQNGAARLVQDLQGKPSGM